MAEKFTFDEAKRLSIKKWQMIVDNGGVYDESVIENDPELRELYYHCGFCHLRKGDCSVCELNINGELSCSWGEHPFNVWSLEPNTQNAVAVLDLVKCAKEGFYSGRGIAIVDYAE